MTTDTTNAINLQDVFNLAKSQHPHLVLIDTDAVRKTFRFVDAYGESGSYDPSRIGRLVLQETRLCRCFETDDPETDEWREETGGPRHHWGFMMPLPPVQDALAH